MNPRVIVPPQNSLKGPSNITTNARIINPSSSSNTNNIQFTNNLNNNKFPNSSNNYQYKQNEVNI